ncbi:MAG: sugar ABC transporter ATP-binding protein, partial [Thermoprotei archaeon]
MVEVVLKHVTKKFGKVVAVDDLSLEVRDKEFVVLLGPSGCGKSTTLRLIAGLEKPDSGEIWIGDKLVNDVDPTRRNVAMVFQSYALYPHMTVYGNIEFPLKMAGVPKKERKKKVLETAEFLGISELLDRKPSQLSGGQQQRVALARALVREPQVFLMDEPLSNLDAKLRVKMRFELRKLQKKLGITTIYVTHDQVEAMTMADRIAVMNAGKLQQYGTPEEIFYKPSNIFVAGFVGSPPMNFVKGKVVSEEALVFDVGIFKLKIPNIYQKLAGSEYVLGFRPQHVVVSATPSEDLVEGYVVGVEKLGVETYAHIYYEDTEVVLKIPDSL